MQPYDITDTATTQKYKGWSMVDITCMEWQYSSKELNKILLH